MLQTMIDTAADQVFDEYSENGVIRSRCLGLLQDHGSYSAEIEFAGGLADTTEAIEHAFDLLSERGCHHSAVILYVVDQGTEYVEITARSGQEHGTCIFVVTRATGELPTDFAVVEAITCDGWPSVEGLSAPTGWPWKFVSIEAMTTDRLIPSRRQ